MNRATPGTVIEAFSGVSEPTPRMVTMVSKPELLVISRPGTMPLSPANSATLDLSSVSGEIAVKARAVFCRSVDRRSAVTVISSIGAGVMESASAGTAINAATHGNPRRTDFLCSCNPQAPQLFCKAQYGG